MKNSVIVPFSCGVNRFNMLLEEEDNWITHLDFCAADTAKKKKAMSVKVNLSPVLSETIRQLDRYFAGTQKEFVLPVRPAGTEFQQKVWRELAKIPYGQTVSYGRVAANIGSPKASRAVGGANHCNPVSIIIPCHRVIGADGKLTGYGGGLKMKKMLLKLEQEYSS